MTAAEKWQAPELPKVIYRQGIHLLGTVLWFDAVARQELCFLSNAIEAVRPAQHRKVVCTEETARLITLRGGRARALSGPYGHSVRLGPLTLEMFPSGHMLGASQLLTTIDGVRVLYTGTICTDPLPTANPLETPEADLIIASAHCVDPSQRSPLSRMAAEEVLAFVDDALSDGLTPTLLVEPLGQGQDVLRLLGDAGHRTRAHRTLYRNALAYRECGVRFPRLQRFKGRVAPGEVLVYSRRARGATPLQAVPNRAVALLDYLAEPPPDGSELVPVDAVIPYGNLSSCSELLDWLLSCDPTRVVFHGPNDRTMARRLARHGVETEALSQTGQLPLFA